MNVPVTIKIPDFELLESMIDWLSANVGAQNSEWRYGVVPNRTQNPDEYKFFFKTRSPAMMFKLAWAGA